MVNLKLWDKTLSEVDQDVIRQWGTHTVANISDDDVRRVGKDVLPPVVLQEARMVVKIMVCVVYDKNNRWTDRQVRPDRLRSRVLLQVTLTRRLS